MSIKISDGKGKGTLASVSTDNRLDVSSRSNARQFYVSRDKGQVYSWSSADSAAAATEYTIYVKNNSDTQLLFITDIHVSSSVTAMFKASTVTGVADGGAVITGINLNRTSGNVADATARGNGAITTIVEEVVLKHVRVGAGDSGEIDFKDALILGKDDALAIENDINAGGEVDITVTGFFEDK